MHARGRRRRRRSRVCLGDAEADAGVEDVADAEGFGVADFDGRGVGVGASTWAAGPAWPACSAGAIVSDPGRRWTAGSLPAAGTPGVVTAWWDWAARAPVACRPVTVISVALVAATTHSATAAAAVAAPGLARILSQLKILRTSPGPAGRQAVPDGPDSSACGVLAAERVAARSSTGSRNPGGSAGSGSSRASTSGRSDPCRLAAQVWQCSMCRAASFPVWTVSFPSQPTSKAPSSGHA